jgi:hypothetical protein
MGDDQLTLNPEHPLTGCLVGRGGTNFVVHVVVELVEPDQTVLVAVGVTGLQTRDQRIREHRRPALGGVGQFVALEGVLHRARRRDHCSATSAELGLDPDA